MMEPIMVDMRVSRVAPVVEGNLVELVDMVKQMGRTGDLTESQNRRMVGYLGNIDEMRQQIVIMVQRYEDDSKVLKRLLDLVDRIDDVKALAMNSQASEGGGDGGSLESDKEIAKQYDTPFNPLMVSTLNILDVSGLFADNIQEEEEEEEDEDEGDAYWDHDEDLSGLASHPEEPRDVSSINLSVSNLHLPSLFLENSSDLTPHADSPMQMSTLFRKDSTELQPPPLSQSLLQESREKGKGKAAVGSGSGKGKGKGKEKARGGYRNLIGAIGTRKANDLSEESASESESGSESGSSGSEDDGPNGADTIVIGAPWRRANPAASSSSSSSSSSAPPPPPPPPMPSKKKGKAKALTGPCDPVLCKICYDEYNLLEQVYEFKECSHKYCRDCLQDYLTTNINEGAVLDLVCPFPDCDTEVFPNDIKTLCTPDTFSKFERFTVLAALRADPNARYCPNPYCNNGIAADPHNPWVYCNACKFEFCFHCMAERHDGAACGKEALAYLDKKRQSEADAMEKFAEFTESMKALVKPCPTCKSFIEKNDGCNHMTCGNQTCRAQFCWLCLSVYASDHFQDMINFPNCFDKQYWTPPDMLNNVYVPPYVPPRTRRFANIAKKVGMYMGVGVAVVTLGVPAAVIGGPVYGCFQLHKRLQSRRRRQRRDSFVPPSAQRIEEARMEAARLYALEHS